MGLVIVILAIIALVFSCMALAGKISPAVACILLSIIALLYGLSIGGYLPVGKA
jgi:FtsH-binding integral membrane protein